MIPMMMDKSILVIMLIQNTYKLSSNNVIPMKTDLLVLVKPSNVLLNVKMNGELNTVQKLNQSSVLTHIPTVPVKENGLVEISSILPKKSLLFMMLTVMVT